MRPSLVLLAPGIIHVSQLKHLASPVRAWQGYVACSHGAVLANAHAWRPVASASSYLSCGISM